MTMPMTEKSGVAAQPRDELPLPVLRWMPIIVAAVSLILISLTARESLINLYERWMNEEEYGYGFIAAALVPFFFWRSWLLIRASTDEKKWLGLAIVIISQLFAVIGTLAESYFIEQVAFISSLLGLMMVLFGTRPVRFFVPLAILLLLTIPWPYTLQAIITVKLQLVSTDLGVAVIRLMGIPVFAEGNIIDLGQYKLHVAEACSGLRYLLPLTCISFMLAYLYKAPLWKRALIVTSAPLITVLINSFRIAAIAVLVDNFGSQQADGFLHQFEGWVVFLIGALLLVLEILVLERFHFEKINVESVWDRPVLSESARLIPLRSGSSAIITILICLVSLLAAHSITRAYEIAPKLTRESFVAFPTTIDDWSGKEGRLEQPILDVLKATDVYLGDFSRGTDKLPVNLFVAFYDSLSKGGAIHSPRVCLPGAGWEFASFEERDFGELAPGTAGTFTRTVVQKGEERILMYYWFQQRERRTSNEFAMKYYLLVDGLTKSRKDGALVRIYTAVSRDGDLAQAEERLRTFARAAIPRMIDYLPH